mgnify:CR=1 FL=1
MPPCRLTILISKEASLFPLCPLTLHFYVYSFAKVRVFFVNFKFILPNLFFLDKSIKLPYLFCFISYFY